MNTFRNGVSLAPIVVALVMLASISLLGFIVALWPAEPVAAAPAEGHELVGDSFAMPPCRGSCPKWI